MTNLIKINRWIWALLTCSAMASLITGLAGTQTALPGSNADHYRECVILLHGLGRSARSMAAVAAVLLRRGYTVVNWTMPPPANPWKPWPRWTRHRR